MLASFAFGGLAGLLDALLLHAARNEPGPQSRLAFAVLLPSLGVHRLFFWREWGTVSCRLVDERFLAIWGFGCLGFAFFGFWHALGLTLRRARRVLGGTALALLALLVGTALSAEKGGCEADYYTVAPHGDRLAALGVSILPAGWLALGCLAWADRTRRPRKEA